MSTLTTQKKSDLENPWTELQLGDISNPLHALEAEISKDLNELEKML